MIKCANAAHGNAADRAAYGAHHHTLAEVRECFDTVGGIWTVEDDVAAGDAAAEMYAENAWLRAAEYDPEAEGFDAWERSRGVYDYV